MLWQVISIMFSYYKTTFLSGIFVNKLITTKYE